MTQKSASCIIRHPGNPILSAANIPYPATLIFNAGVAKFRGRYVMLFRNDYGGTPGQDGFAGTNIGLAWSDDGIQWTPEDLPWIEWNEGVDGEIRRAYDPRITVIDDRAYLCFAVDTKHGVRGGVAVTDDFKDWKILNLSTPDNRNMVILPERVNGKLCRLERPFPVYGRGAPENFDLWFSDSPDGVYWGNHQLVLGSEQVPWSNSKIGPGAPPVKTEQGWLTLFHAVSKFPDREFPAWHAGWNKSYMMGVMLLDLDEPWKVIGMHREPLMVAETDYELNGFRGDVLFPGGMILEPDGEVKIYYGAADTVECLATARVEDLIALCQEPFPG